MIGEIKFLIGELKKNPLATVCGLLIASVVFLVLYIISQEKKWDEKEVKYQAAIQLNAFGMINLKQYGCSKFRK